MKVITFLFALLFSFSVLADCCNSFELENCKTELLQSDDCEGTDHTSSPDDSCHCSFNCTVKILTHKSNDLKNTILKLDPSFFKYIHHFKNLNPSPDLHPPIV